ncbi:MAG: hypothetical protein AB7D27_15655 [Desulfomicrobium sp.]
MESRTHKFSNTCSRIQVVSEISILHKFFGNEIGSPDFFDKEIQHQEDEIENLNTKLLELNKTTYDINDDNINIIREKIISIRRVKTEKFNLYNKYMLDINDSERFIQSLRNKIKSLDESSLMINALSDISFQYCPACFQEIDPKEGCALCGQSDATHDIKTDPTFKIRKEIEFQINESERILELKKERLYTTKLEIESHDTELKISLDELNSLQIPFIGISSESRRILMEIGFKKNEIQKLNEQKNKFAKLYTLYNTKNEYSRQVDILTEEITTIEKKTQANYERKRNQLSDLTIKILRKDKGTEEIFQTGLFVDFSFEEDRVLIDQKAIFSASSMIFLKNAFRTALFQASCIDKSYIYPRFLLMDNIEDKGMVMERSKLFQLILVEISKSISIPHQIIFTTSMIDESLDNEQYCIGIKYNDSNKSLNFAN